MGTQRKDSHFLCFIIGGMFLILTGCAEPEDSGSIVDKVFESVVTSQVCDVPEAWPIPDSKRTVGDGSLESCSEEALRSAVEEGGFINFDCGEEQVVISVNSQIEVGHKTVIDGEGRVTLNGKGQSRIFFVTSALSVRNLRFVNGNAKGKDENGGAVSGGWRSKLEVIGCLFEDNAADNAGGAVSAGTGSELTVVSSQFVHNTSGYGGAIYSLWSPLHIVNSEFTDNYTHVNAGGGAIGTDGALDPAYRAEETVGGKIEICGSLFQNNKAWGAGGAAFLWVYPPDEILIDRCTIKENTLAKDAEGLAMGGGMRISNGTITIKATSIFENSAETHGGGLSLDCEPTCTLTNTTFYDNKVTDGFGGAIFGDKLRVNNVTFANNFANSQGGALFGGKDWVLKNSVFYNNKAGNPWGQTYSCSAMGTGENLLQWVSDFSGVGSDPCIAEVIAADPLLALPADNGGATFTMLPDAKSPALQVGKDCEPIDQRGQPRDPSACDLGAVERP